MSATENPLGRKVAFPESYMPSVLYVIPRWASRSLLDIDKKHALFGFDCWRAYELSWLNPGGKPVACMAEIYFDARSEFIVESKSMKLYLHSLNRKRFDSSEEAGRLIAQDLTAASNSEVEVVLHEPASPSFALREPAGECLDSLDIEVTAAAPDETLLLTQSIDVTDETLYSHLFRSNCPITGQPDWGSFFIRYSGAQIDHAGLLHYLCSFRSHHGYHEECAERMYRDILRRCEPDELIVGLNFLRRGGLDINPFRSNRQISPWDLVSRYIRQ
ncbi:MAG: NADPH-dependent 7-cyano-7-deazaguanine reductase QueF [Pseudohongiellaceae bacterium]